MTFNVNPSRHIRETFGRRWLGFHFLPRLALVVGAETDCHDTRLLAGSARRTRLQHR